jgi:hypothetical protein
MIIWAVLAAKQAAIATGFGAGLVPAIGTGSLDGFVIGAAMTGACFTALTAPGRAKRRAATAGMAATAVTGAGSATVTAASAASAASAGGAGGAAGAADAETARATLLRRYFLAAEQFEPNWERQVPAAERAPGQDQGDSRQDGRAGDWAQDGRAGDWAQDGQGVNGYQSRHRLGEGSAIRRPRQEARRSAPKHAAPPSSFASRMSGMFASRAVLSAARH